MRDERHFPEPDQFIPSRYLDDSCNINNNLTYDPSKLVFGFGRRFVLDLLVALTQLLLEHHIGAEVALDDILLMT